MKNLFKRIGTALVAVLVAVAAVPLGGVYNAFADSADPLKPESKTSTSGSGVTLWKTAEPVKDMINQYKVTLRVEAPKTLLKSDTVIVLDRSGSMDGGRMTAAKDAAKGLVSQLFSKNTDPNNPINRVALVSFASNVTVDTCSKPNDNKCSNTNLGNFSDQELNGFIDPNNDLNNLNYLFSSDSDFVQTKIDGLSALDGTWTQSGIRIASALLKKSDANIKTMIVLSDGVPTYSYRIYDAENMKYLKEGGPNVHLFIDEFEIDSTKVSQSDYDYSTRVGDGGTGGFFGLRGELWKRINPFATPAKYYNHGESAIAEAGFCKNDINAKCGDIYAIALNAGEDGERILRSMASGITDKEKAKFFTATTNTAALGEIFKNIAGKIENAIDTAKINDPMGDAFVVSSTDDTAVTIVDKKTIEVDNLKWQFDCTSKLDGVTKVYCAEHTYIVDANSDKSQMNFQLNDKATLKYTYDGKEVTDHFPIPMAPKPVAINVTKKMGQGDQTPTGTKFDMEVTGPTGFTKETFPLGKNDPKTIVKAFPVGSYGITETDINSNTPISGVTFDNYDVSYSSETFDIAKGQATDVNIIVTNTYETTTVTASKKWEDSGDQDDKRAGMDAYFAVMDGSTVVDYKEIDILKDTDDFISKALPKNRNGQPINYTVVEATGCETATGCKQISGKQANGYDIKVDSVNNLITNSYTPETVNIAVNKSWKDDNNRDGLRTLNTAVRFCVEGTTKSGSYNKTTCNDDLGAGLGQLVGLQDNILVEFKDLPKYHNKGEDIYYRVYEDLNLFKQNTYQADYCYKGQVSKCKYIPTKHLDFTSNAVSMLVENQYDPKKRDIKVQVKWDDDDNVKRPKSVDVELSGATTPKTINIDQSGDNTCAEWCVTLNEFVNENGSEIKYMVSQAEPAGYGTFVTGDMASGFVITNALKYNVEALVNWDDSNNQYNSRPASVRIILEGDDGNSYSATVDENGGRATRACNPQQPWCVSFNDLPRMMNDNGTLRTIKYTIKQVPALIANYATAISGDINSGYVITNTYNQPFVAPTPISPDTGVFTAEAEKVGARVENNMVVLAVMPVVVAMLGMFAIVAKRKKAAKVDKKA